MIPIAWLRSAGSDGRLPGRCGCCSRAYPWNSVRAIRDRGLVQRVAGYRERYYSDTEGFELTDAGRREIARHEARERLARETGLPNTPRLDRLMDGGDGALDRLSWLRPVGGA